MCGGVFPCQVGSWRSCRVWRYLDGNLGGWISEMGSVGIICLYIDGCISKWRSETTDEMIFGYIWRCSNVAWRVWLHARLREVEWF